MADEATAALFAALCALRDARDPFVRDLDAEWRHVDAWLRLRGRRSGRDPDSAHQETLITIGGAVRSMRATSPAGAAAWLRTIHERRRCDEARSSWRDASWSALRWQSLGGDPFARVAAPSDAPTLDAARVVDVLEARIARHVARTRTTPGRRRIAVLQARAALRRLVLEEDGDELAAALGVEVSRDRLYKWTERGRAVVLGALDGWTTAPGTLVELVRSAMWERRADAGAARPHRRTRIAA